MTAQPADALARCVGDPERFLRETWARRTHLQEAPAGAATGRDAEGFPDLLTLADVDALLSAHSLRAPFFRLVKQGTPLPVASYTRESRIGGVEVTGVADAARIFAAYDDGATIVLQGLQRYWPPLTQFSRELEQTLGHPTQVNAYITPPGSQGLNVHSDEHDVFVLQAFGAKTWEIHPAPAEPPDGPPRQIELVPGATLYLPQGTPHAARTQQVVSGHLTVGVVTTTWHSLLSEVVERLGQDPGLDERLPAGYHRNPTAFAAAVAGKLAELARSLDKIDHEEVATALADRFWTTRSPVLAGGLVDRVRLPGLRDESLVRRRPGSICELRAADDGRLRVLVGDRELRMPAALDRSLRAVLAAPQLRVGDLTPYLDAESRQVLVHRLVQEGLLELVAP